MILFSALWLLLGIANLITTLVRPMPLSSIDFLLLTTALDIIPHYLSIVEIVLCVIAIVAAIILTVYLIRRARKYDRDIRKCLSPFLVTLVLFAAFIVGGMTSNNLNISYADVKKAYDDHGFVYCFSSSLFIKGIPEPDDYSQNEVVEIIEKYSNETSEESYTPNIIVVQLESFFDVLKYSKYTLNADPLPNYHKICEKFGEGAISVPSNGGGTVNSEFEILTGMNLEFFGAVEYPYTTILKKSTCEAAPFILDDYGYKSHAIHNHTGVFYRRNEVYPNLGFDTFTPLEYMQHEKNELGWAKDNAILPCIINAVESTSEQDFVFAVTVEGHGMYDNVDRSDIEFKVTDREMLEGAELKKAYMYEYYCNLLNETDKFIGDLYDYVMSSDEEFVVVLYGDHLPSLEFDSDLYEYKSDYVTGYTVFSNNDWFEYEYDGEISASRLMSTVFEVLGIDSGIINKINRNHDEPGYEDDLEAVQYDMLYGQGYSYNGKPYNPKNIKFGCKDILIKSISFEDGFLTVYGSDFTVASKIAVNGWERDTEYIDSNTLKCSQTKVEQGDIIAVRQCAVDGKSLSEEIYIIN